MKRQIAVLLRFAVLVPLAACAEPYPGGGNGSSTGGSGGVDEPPLRVSFPALELEVRSQLFAPTYFGDGLLPNAYQLYLVERARACSDGDGLRIDEGEGWVAVSFNDPAPGACALRGPFQGQREDIPPPTGCHVSLDAGRGNRWVHSARAGSARLDRIDGTTLAGELRLLVPERPVQSLGCGSSWGGNGPGDMEFLGGMCDCDGPAGSFTCETTDVEDLDCCDDGIPQVEVVVPFEATRCADAGLCALQPCAPYLIGSCGPALPSPGSCETACEAYVATCRECLGCTARGCEEQGRCELDECLATCRALAPGDPLVALSLTCLEATSSCDGWASCVSACGE